MSKASPGLTYRPDPEAREILEAYAKRTHRSLTQAITHLIVTYAYATEPEPRPVPRGEQR